MDLVHPARRMTVSRLAVLSWPPAMTAICPPARSTSFARVSIPSRAVGRPPEVKHAFDAQVDQGIEGFQRLTGLVKRLVKRDAKRPGQSDELGGLVAVDCAGSAVRTPRTTPAAPSALATSMSCRMTAISGSE